MPKGETGPAKRFDSGARNASMVLLTGPSGSGKSTLAGQLERKGWERIDGDALAKSLYVPGGPLLRALAGAFGGNVLKADGSLDTLRLGEIVFPSLAQRRKLNRLVYPPFLKALRARLRAARQAGRPVVADVAVYYDMGAPRLGLPVGLVLAPEAARVARLQAKGLALPRARARARALRFGAAQRRAADLLLDGMRPRAALLKDLLRGLQALAAAPRGITRV